MKKISVKLFLSSLLIMLTCIVTGCGDSVQQAQYQQISASEAKDMMDSQTDCLILDVREENEYNTGHIPGAVLFPVGTIDQSTAQQLIPDQDTVLLVYCRSGNRSKTAASTLADLGYTQVYEFGGITDWPYDIDS